MTTTVNFETSKLLKEKEFNIPQLYFYIDGDISWKVDNTRCRNQIEGEYAAPTIVEVIMWLYEKHGIWISVEQNIYENKFDYLITQRKANSWYVKSNDELVFNSPTEAYEAAIEFTLKNLI